MTPRLGDDGVTYGLTLASIIRLIITWSRRANSGRA